MIGPSNRVTWYQYMSHLVHPLRNAFLSRKTLHCFSTRIQAACETHSPNALDFRRTLSGKRNSQSTNNVFPEETWYREPEATGIKIWLCESHHKNLALIHGSNDFYFGFWTDYWLTVAVRLKRSAIGIAHAAVTILHHGFRKQDQQQQEKRLLKQATLSLSL